MKLCVLLTCYLCLVFEFCCAQHFPAAGHAGRPVDPPPVDYKLVPSNCNAENNGTNRALEIRLPFMDMEVRHERQLHLMRDVEQQQLFVLHGYELLQLFVGRQNKRLVLLGTLNGRVRQMEVLGAAVVTWQHYLLIAVVLDGSAEIYQVSIDRVDGVASTPLSIELIQEFALPGSFKELHLIKPTEDKVLLLLALQFTSQQSKYKTFEWLDTFFNPVEELMVPAIETLNIVGTQPKYLISGRVLRPQSKLVLTVYELKTYDMKLQRQRSFTVQASHVQTFSFRGRNYLIACGDTAKCFYFRMMDGQFVFYRKQTMKDLRFSQITANDQSQVLAAMRSNGEVFVFNNPRLDCYNGFGSNNTYPSKLFIQRNELNETFLVLSYRRPSVTLVRMVELGGNSVSARMDNSDDLSAVQQHRHEFEDVIGGLRSLLLRRKMLMETLRRMTEKQHILNVKDSLTVQGGSIGLVRLEGQHLRSPTQLLQRVQHMRETYKSGRRVRRSFGVGNSSETEVLKVRRLHVDNLIFDGAVLPGHHLEQPTASGTSAAILTIKGELLTHELHTPQLMTPDNYKRIKRSTPQLMQGMSVRHLQVQSINNVSWFDFYDSLFLRNRDTVIKGRLIMQGDTKVVNLWTPLLNGLVVQQLFNLKQPQIVTSNVFMSAFFASQLEATQINGLNFAEDIVFRGDNNTLIKTPVRINHMTVSNGIQVANKTKWERLAEAESDLLPEPARLQQYYTGTVTINGSLTINNLKRDTNKTRIMLDTQSLAREHLQFDFLLMHTPQNFTAGIIFDNAKITMPSFSTGFINGQPTKEHLFSGGHELAESSKPIFIIFMNATVQGNIVVEDYVSKLSKIDSNAVRHGEVSSITGYKRFEAPLTVDKMWTESFNELPVANLVKKAQLAVGNQTFEGLKSFARIVVGETVNIEVGLNASRLNRLHLQQLLSHDYYQKRLELPSVLNVQNLVFQRINGIPFDEVFSKVSVLDDNRLVLHKDLLIDGNVRFEGPLQVESINGLNWSAYREGLVLGDTNARISGQKSFLADVTITDALQTPTINELDLSALFENTLLRATPQAISGAYTFGVMKATNLDLKNINGVPTSAFIDTRQAQIDLAGDVYVSQLMVEGELSGRLTADMGNQLTELEASLKSLQSRQWRNLVVLGDMLWNTSSTETQQTQLEYLRRNAVTRSGNQTISGHVELRLPIIKHMNTTEPFPRAVDFDYIAHDALLKNATEIQTVVAPQIFLQSVTATGALRVSNLTHFGLLNDIELERFNASLYRKSSGNPIGGPLNFVRPPIVGQLIVHGNVNGLNTTNVYQQSNDALPPVRLQNLRVQKRLSVSEINGMGLNRLLQNRIPLQGAAKEVFGCLSFEHLVLGQQCMLRTINGIALDNVVYKHSNQLQAITGAKTVPKGITLAGPSHVMRLNGQDLSESYQQSIFTDRSYSIDSLVLDNAVFQAGLHWKLEENNGDRSRAISDDTMEQQLLDLETVVGGNQTKPSLLYLDYEPTELTVNWSKPETTEIMNYTAYQVDNQQQLLQCEQRLIQAQIYQKLQSVYLKNITSSLLHADAAMIHVKAENYCSMQPRKLRSKIKVNCRAKQLTLGMKHHISNLELYSASPRANYSLLLINAVDTLHLKQDEVRVLRIDEFNCTLSDWQSLKLAVGKLIKLVQLGNETLLITSGLLEQRPALAIYRLDNNEQQFQLQQLIQGDYDLAELLQVANGQYQLILSCRRCQLISIYAYDMALAEFVPMQELRLSAPIEALQPYALNGNDVSHLLVLSAPGSEHFYLFSFAHIEGWVQRSYGYVGEVKWMWPLKFNGPNSPILLLCGELQCRLVRAQFA